MRDPGCQLYRLPMASKARLVLHFDINKTVLMADRAQGASTACVVNMLLSECAWGRLEAGPQWVPVGRLATDRCATLAAHRLGLGSPVTNNKRPGSRSGGAPVCASECRLAAPLATGQRSGACPVAVCRRCLACFQRASLACACMAEAPAHCALSIRRHARS
jgi:hypothetical protein